MARWHTAFRKITRLPSGASFVALQTVKHAGPGFVDGANAVVHQAGGLGGFADHRLFQFLNMLLCFLYVDLFWLLYKILFVFNLLVFSPAYSTFL